MMAIWASENGPALRRSKHEPPAKNSITVERAHEPQTRQFDYPSGSRQGRRAAAAPDGSPSQQALRFQLLCLAPASNAERYSPIQSL